MQVANQKKKKKENDGETFLYFTKRIKKKKNLWRLGNDTLKK